MFTNKVLIIQLEMTTSNRRMHAAFNQGLRCETQYDSEALREMVQGKRFF